MADKNISELQTAAEVLLTDWLHLRQGGVDRKAEVSKVVKPLFASLGDYADDVAASAAGVAVGSLYRTGSTLKVRVA